MRIKSCTINNFGSYKEFNTDFSDNGLTLLHGRTGSGKSTIPDMVFWIIFGETAKGGSVDDIRNWQSNEPTVGTLEVETNEGSILITRVRGKTSDNDLYWVINGGDELIRGKDLKDTQALLEAKLGVSPLLYEVGAYFHEFSPIGSFFLSKAKDRRTIFEQIADLSIPKKLSEQVIIQRKIIKEELDVLNNSLSNETAKLDQLSSQFDIITETKEKWETQRKITIKSLMLKSQAFDTDKEMRLNALKAQSEMFESAKQKELKTAESSIGVLIDVVKPAEEVEEAILKLRFKIDEIKSKRCGECGGPVDSTLCDRYRDKISALEKAGRINESNLDKLDQFKKNIVALSKRENPYISQIKDTESKANTYAEIIDAKIAEINPHDEVLEYISQDLIECEGNKVYLTYQIAQISHRLSLLNKLYDLSFDLRGLLLETTVRQAQDRTNYYLETYFEGELKVKFTLEGADSLQVELYKNGYNCGYKQLSKGQRGLLKLCFSMAIMESASNQAGVHFDTVFLDEALDGLDSEFKLKAFDMLQELSKHHSSIFVIDHAVEFQNLFESQIHVTMKEDVSYVDDHTIIGDTAYESKDDKERT